MRNFGVISLWDFITPIAMSMYDSKHVIKCLRVVMDCVISEESEEVQENFWAYNHADISNRRLIARERRCRIQSLESIEVSVILRARYFLVT